jgi:hypothetical protein
MNEFEKKILIAVIGFIAIVWLFWFCFIRKQDWQDY